jgi:hypothetical protein
MKRAAELVKGWSCQFVLIPVLKTASTCLQQERQQHRQLQQKKKRWTGAGGGKEGEVGRGSTRSVLLKFVHFSIGP